MSCITPTKTCHLSNERFHCFGEVWRNHGHGLVVHKKFLLSWTTFYKESVLKRLTARFPLTKNPAMRNKHTKTVLLFSKKIYPEEVFGWYVFGVQMPPHVDGVWKPRGRNHS